MTIQDSGSRHLEKSPYLSNGLGVRDRVTVRDYGLQGLVG